MPSFDVVSELDEHELNNAVDQANREVANRFDFKGTGAKFELAEFVVSLEAPADFQLKQMMDMLTQKLSKRGIDVAAMDPQEPEIALNKARQKVVMRHGVGKDDARKIVKQHGGTIRAENREAGGARFVVRLKPDANQTSEG